MHITGNGKGVINISVKIIITSLILGYLFSRIPFKNVAYAARHASLGLLLGATLLQFIMRLINAAQMSIFVKQQKMDFSIIEISKINFISQFYGLLMPGELSASLVKWYKLAEKGRMRAQAVASILMSRIVTTLSLAVMGILAFIIERPKVSLRLDLLLISGLLFFLLFYGAMLNFNISLAIDRILKFRIISALPKTVNEKISKVWNSVKEFQKLDSFAINYSFFLSFIYHVAGIISIYLILRSLNISIPIISVAWIRVAVIFIQMAPISISGLGVREGAFVFLLSGYNVSNSDALATSLILFAISVIMGLIGGIIEAKTFLLGKRSGAARNS